MKLTSKRRAFSCPFTIAVACCAAAAPVLSPYGDFTWAITTAFLCLAVIRSRVEASVPLAIRLMSLGLALGALPYMWTGDLEDLRRPLMEAAFFYAAGGCGFEFTDKGGTQRVRRFVLALAILAVLQAVGVITRYGQDPFSTVRLSWNLTGLLAAVAAVAAVGCLPGVAATVLLWASVGIVAVSGSRGAAMFTIVGTFLILALSRGVLRRLVLIWSLCAAVGIGWTLLGRIRPEVVSDPVVTMRALRSITFEDADRAESWVYWLDRCMETPSGTGMSAIDDRDFGKVGSHNSWLDLWARGGLPCAVMFTIGQIVLLSALVRLSSLEQWRSLAIALVVAASVRMCVEVFPLSTSYGMNGLLVLFVGGTALSRRELLALPTVQSARTIDLSSRTPGLLVGVGH
jgi:hypothetical protein